MVSKLWKISLELEIHSKLKEGARLSKIERVEESIGERVAKKIVINPEHIQFANTKEKCQIKSK